MVVVNTVQGMNGVAKNSGDGLILIDYGGPNDHSTDLKIWLLEGRSQD